MMTLKVYGSSSSGNAYLLDNGEEALLLECGMPMKEIVRDLGSGLSRILGCVLSHEHQDHARMAGAVLNMRIPLITSPGTARALFDGWIPDGVRCLDNLEHITLGRFVITPMETVHDAAHPYAYHISHPDIGTMIFATDTAYMRYVTCGVCQLLVECNYDKEILARNYDEGRIELKRKERVIRSHMSIDTCEKYVDQIRQFSSGKLRNVVLLHLSDDNSNEEDLRRRIQALTRARVTVARPGVTIELNKEPF